MSYHIALIDADNTLLDFSRSEHDALCDCLRARGLPTNPEIIACYSAINDAYWKRLERGEVTREALCINRFADFFHNYGYAFDAKKMADDYMEALSTKSYLLPGALDFCQHLYGECRMFLITNGNARVQAGRFDPSPLFPLFENCFISQKIGYEKPHIEYFKAVMKEIPDFDPQDTIVVGDSLTSDIQGGINAGLDTCWFNPLRRPLPCNLPVTYVAESFSEIERIILFD